MAFSFDTLVNDQKQAAVDVVDTITPRQVKQIGNAYKEGLNASPKQVINETLEQFTGINLSQGAGAEGLGQQLKSFFTSQAGSLALQLEQQILGCINTQIRDLMNRVPELAFALDFENQINQILGDFRNKLEQKIDGELRKLAYKKIKIQQTALFKQRIRAKIKDICPGATPASVAEVRDFNNKVKGLLEKRQSDSVVPDTSPTIPATSIATKSKPSKQVPTAVEGPSESLKKTVREDPVKTQELVSKKTEEAQKEVEDTALEQLDEGDDTTIEALSETVPKEEQAQKTWSAYKVVIVRGSTLNQGGTSNVDNINTILDKTVPEIISEFKNNIDNNRKWTTNSDQLLAAERKQKLDGLNPEDYIVLSTGSLLSYGLDDITSMYGTTISWTYEIVEKTDRKFPQTVLSMSEVSKTVGDNYIEANNSTLDYISKQIKKGYKNI